MPVLTVKVPQETAARLERMAARRRMTKSAFLREALEKKLALTPDEPSLHDAMGPTLGGVDSGRRDLGHNPKHLAGFGRR